MDTRFIFICLSFHIDKGVCGDEVKMRIVMEGHSVTLYTDIIKEKDDMIVWYYGPENTFLATINGKASHTMYYDGEDERFMDRLRLCDQTGDLTISNTRTSDSGLYTLKISRNYKASYKRFNVTVSGVLNDPYEVKSVSLREGHSLILYIHELKQKDDVIEWWYGPENTFVIKFNGEINKDKISPDERFRDRVKLEDQTGALMISDTRCHHSGLHQFRINSRNKVSYKKFNVTVHPHLPVPVISPSSERSSSSKHVVLCSVISVRHVTLSWYNGSIIHSSISVSDLTTSVSLHLEVHYEDTNTYTCVVNNSFRSQIQHLSPDVFQLRSESCVMWLWVIPVLVLICICVCVCVYVCILKQRADPMKTSNVLTDDESSINSGIMSNAGASRSHSSNNVWVKQKSG